MDWGNAIVRKISRAGGAADGGPVESLEMELHLAGDFKKTKKKVTWIAAPSEVTPVTLLDYDYLITKKKLEEDDKVEELLNPKTEFRCVFFFERGPSPRSGRSLCYLGRSAADRCPPFVPQTHRTAAIADHNVRSLPAGSIIQFERKGFYIVDKAFDPSKPDQPAELILIPDGKASSIALKYQVPGGGEKEKEKAAAGGKKAGGKTPAKDKDAAAQAKKKGASTERVGLPEVAPKEPVESVMKSEGTKGYDIPVRVRPFFSFLAFLFWSGIYLVLTVCPSHCRPRCTAWTRPTGPRRSRLRSRPRCTMSSPLTSRFPFLSRRLHYIDCAVLQI